MPKQIDWPGLLKWSLSYSGKGPKLRLGATVLSVLDGTSPTTETSAERLRFLEAAFKEAMLQYEDANDVVRQAVAKINTPDGGASEGDIISALTLIQKCVDEAPEISRNLEKLGALQVLFDATTSSNKEISEVSLQTLAFALPNNPAVQLSAWRRDGLGTLMNQQRRHHGPLTPARIGAISGLVRHQAPIENALEPCDHPAVFSFYQDFILSRGGCALLAEGLASTDPKVQAKCANLQRHLLESYALPASLAVEHCLPTLLAALIADTEETEEQERSLDQSEALAHALEVTLRRCREEMARTPASNIVCPKPTDSSPPPSDTAAKAALPSADASIVPDAPSPPPRTTQLSVVGRAIARRMRWLAQRQSCAVEKGILANCAKLVLERPPSAE